MEFGDAIGAIKAGLKVYRSGWNGKGMFLFLNKGSVSPGNRLALNGNSALYETGDTGTVTRHPCISMMAADGGIVTGWLASQTDMLANDWHVVLTKHEVEHES